MAKRWTFEQWVDRFWEYVLVVPYDRGCWLWVGTIRPDGYGQMQKCGQKRFLLAHRISWEMHYGPILNGLFVCHHCDNPRCVRPEHLFLGTCADNMRDCAEKGRAPGYSLPGEKNPKAKLTKEQVLTIRSMNGTMTHESIGRLFGIKQPQVSKIISGISWT